MNRRLGRPRIHSKKKTGDRPRKRAGNRWLSRGAMTPSSPRQDWQAFDRDLKQLETAVQALRQRWDHIQTLQQAQQQLEQQLQTPDLPPDELQRLQRQLEELEVQLESAMFDWRSLQEPFWQAVRFGGVGIVIGWILKGIANT